MYFEKLQELFKSKDCDGIKTLIDNHLSELKFEGISEITVNAYYYRCLLKKSDLSNITTIISWVKSNLSYFSENPLGYDIVVELIKLKENGVLTDSQLSSTDYNNFVSAVENSFSYHMYQMSKLFDKFSKDILSGNYKNNITNYISQIQNIFINNIYQFLLQLNEDDKETYYKNLKLIYEIAGETMPSEIEMLKNKII